METTSKKEKGKETINNINELLREIEGLIIDYQYSENVNEDGIYAECIDLIGCKLTELRKERAKFYEQEKNLKK